MQRGSSIDKRRSENFPGEDNLDGTSNGLLVAELSRRATLKRGLQFITVAALAGPGLPELALADATPQQKPKAFVQKLIHDVFAVLSNKLLKDKPRERKQRLLRLADATFDWEQMARSSMGPYWRKLDDEKRKRFIRAFKKLLQKRYSRDLDRFQGKEKMSVIGSEKLGNQIKVKALLITASGERVPIDYALGPRGSLWKVEDMAIETVSLVNHYRGVFKRIKNDDDFAAMMEVLERKARTAPARKSKSSDTSK